MISINIGTKQIDLRRLSAELKAAGLAVGVINVTSRKTENGRIVDTGIRTMFADANDADAPAIAKVIAAHDGSNGRDAWKRERITAYKSELGSSFDQIDELVQAIAFAKTLKDIQSADVVTKRMAIKARIPKP